MMHKFIGVGVDLVDLARAERLVRRHPDGIARFLTPSEFRLWKNSRQRTFAFALIFAAKEAASKSVGQSLPGPAAFRAFRISRKGRRLAVRWSAPNADPVTIDLIPFTRPNLAGMLAYAYSSRPAPLVK